MYSLSSPLSPAVASHAGDRTSEFCAYVLQSAETSTKACRFGDALNGLTTALRMARNEFDELAIRNAIGAVKYHAKAHADWMRGAA